ncbi:MAG: murein biosynthesis integral membrane protein MurJ [Rhizobiales bacterium 62-47]|nr:murein biosynthesis integral membrane protein MurJ [Hyphomicrobiales bacterium]OJY12884.1 MAG: murein biosynthesis integral membrane protein MurJ [Rhizobiales bacterium 62-47]
MIRHLLTVSTGTLASRLLGFMRDAMVAALLGAGPIADAFLVAFQMVNVARRLLTEGALNAALVPAYWRARESDGLAAAAALAGRVLGTVSLALFVAAALIGLAMPLVIGVLAPGFAGQPTLQFAVDDARLMLPYLAFAGPVTVMMGLLNAHHRFALTAFSPLLFNIALIAVMALLLLRQQDAAHAALLIAATVGAAGLLQLLVLAVRGSGLATPLRVSFDREMRGFFAKAIPGMIASSGPQLLIVGGAIIASASPAAVSWLYFANRLIELPLGIVGVAMGTVLVPELTRAAHRDDGAAFSQTMSRSFELALGLALPATLGLMILSAPIVRALFEHGAFTAADTQATALALSWLALGLPAHVLVKTLAPAFFARGDTATPGWAVVRSLAITIAAALLLGHWFGASGVAAAIALGAWSNALGLLLRAAATFGLHPDADARRRLPRIASAALVMGGALWLATALALPSLAEAHGIVRIAALGALIVLAVALYGLLLRAFNVTTWAEAARAWRSAKPHSSNPEGSQDLRP